MRIFCITHDIDGGGAAKSLFLYCREWCKLGCSLTLLSTEPLNPGKNRAKAYRELGIPVHNLRLPLLPVSYISAPFNPFKQFVKAGVFAANFFRVRQIFQAVSPDVILYNSYAAMSAGLFLKGPAVVHIRDVIDYRSLFATMVSRYIRSRVCGAIAIGDREAEQARDMGLHAEVIYNFPDTTPLKSPWPEAPPYRVAVVGQITQAKGQAEFVNACIAAKTRLREKKIHVTVYGGEPREAPKGPAAALRLEVQQAECSDIVDIYGWTDDVEAALNRSHLLVRPDISGSPWGRDIIEAMSLGRPVLSTGSRDIFVKPNNGKLVPLEPVETVAGRLVDAMISMADTTRLQQLGENAFHFAHEHFDPAENAKAALRILQEAAAMRKHTRAPSVEK